MKMKARGMEYKPCEVKRTLYACGADKPLTIAGGFLTIVESDDMKTSTHFIIVKYFWADVTRT